MHKLIDNKNLENTFVEDAKDQYEILIKEMTRENYLEVFKLCLRNSSTKEGKKAIILLYLSAKHEFMDINKIASILINADIKSTSVILFLPENYYKELSSYNRQQFTNNLSEQNYSVSSLVSILNTKESSIDSVVLNLLNESNTNEFIRECLCNIDTLPDLVIKNFSAILASLDVHFFVNYNPFISLLQHENTNLRGAIILIIEKLILSYKESRDLEIISSLTSILREHLMDKSYFVRSKVLSAFTVLYKNSAILINQRNEIGSEVCRERRMWFGLVEVVCGRYVATTYR